MQPRRPDDEPDRLRIANRSAAAPRGSRSRSARRRSPGSRTSAGCSAPASGRSLLGSGRARLGGQQLQAEDRDDDRGDDVEELARVSGGTARTSAVSRMCSPRRYAMTAPSIVSQRNRIVASSSVQTSALCKHVAREHAAREDRDLDHDQQRRGRLQHGADGAVDGDASSAVQPRSRSSIAVSAWTRSSAAVTTMVADDPREAPRTGSRLREAAAGLSEQTPTPCRRTRPCTSCRTGQPRWRNPLTSAC